ncbi:DUF2975 domain-containing protein [Nonomuraea roseoviolacea]|uniref:DUF2975 domain-containing protein n=1 Tax=Nonomuraea roseoviolacea subsp. carminata TaxID=160689 RepID=A0ABT1JXV0_9ACTN|nr:DUF2975 domain-containing protein [Nonomuraea roseoviolacea]MCP2346242.1 hypothetical protein [Nonomuraea roseoviolacea subsp. carminata]
MSSPQASSLKWTVITVRVLLALFVAVTAYEIGRAVVTGGENAFGSRGTQSLVCATGPGALSVPGNFTEDSRLLAAMDASTSGPFMYPLAQGAEVNEPIPQLCRDDSSVATQLLYQSSRFATTAVLLAGLVLLERLISRARREGGFDVAVVTRLRFLGLFLAAGTLVSSLYTAIAETGLAESMVATTIRRPWEYALHNWSLPWAFLVAGIGLVVMARVVRVGASMREELEGTV